MNDLDKFRKEYEEEYLQSQEINKKFLLQILRQSDSEDRYYVTSQKEKRLIEILFQLFKKSKIIHPADFARITKQTQRQATNTIRGLKRYYGVITEGRNEDGNIYFIQTPKLNELIEEIENIKKIEKIKGGK
jgi:hypothetical protein